MKQTFMTLLFVGLAGVLLVGGLMYLKPGLIEQQLQRFDTIGKSEAEQQRINRINSLPISGEKKNILISRQIFLGAGRHMVVLALGDPKFKGRKEDQTEVWGYHFEGEYRPTILEFDQFKLTNAYKASRVDVEAQYGSY